MRGEVRAANAASVFAGATLLMLLRSVLEAVRLTILVVGRPLGLAGMLLVVGTLVFGFWGEVQAVHSQRWILIAAGLAMQMPSRAAAQVGSKG